MARSICSAPISATISRNGPAIGCSASLAGTLVIAAVGALMQVLVFQRLAGDELRQTLVTIGISDRRRRSDAGGLGRQDLSVRDSRLRSTARWRCRSSPRSSRTAQAVFLRYPLYRLVVFAASVVIGVGAVARAQPHQGRHDDPRRRRRPRDAVGRRRQRAAAVRRRVRHRRRAGRLFRRHRRLGAVRRAGRGRALSAGLAGRRHRRRHGLDHRRRDRRAADRPRRADRPRLFPDLWRRADLRHHGGDAGAAAAGHARQRATARRRSAAHRRGAATSSPPSSTRRRRRSRVALVLFPLVASPFFVFQIGAQIADPRA